jgi:magnesium chelatase family protein
MKLSGGGSLPIPGEISLAHNGVLFLDELPEFPRNSLEILRKPIEDGTITIARIKQSLTYPCDFMLICAMNPCPCGYFWHESKKCICSELTVSKYLSKISGPLLDRIDLHIEVPTINFENISSRKQEESSAEIKKRVDAARKIQTERYKNASLCNAKMPAEIMQDVCNLSKNAENILENAFNNMGLSGRGYSKILKIARTIADLEGSKIIDETHIAEAIQYRSLDRKYWNRNY